MPGPGVGGHCLAVDPYLIIEKAPEQSKLIATAREINIFMPDFVIEQVEKRMTSKSSKIAVLGLSYKGNIDDVRESSAMEIVEKLLVKGYILGVHDPHVKQENVDFKLSSFEDAECILVLTDHSEFKSLSEDVILTKTKQPLVIDIKNCVRINSEKIEYVNFGRLGKVKKGAY